MEKTQAQIEQTNLVPLSQRDSRTNGESFLVKNPAVELSIPATCLCLTYAAKIIHDLRMYGKA